MGVGPSLSGVGFGGGGPELPSLCDVSFQCPLPGEMEWEKGDPFSQSMTLLYKEKGSSIYHTATGQIRAMIE